MADPATATQNTVTRLDVPTGVPFDEFIDALASGRRVVTFDNRGVGATSGSTPHSVAAMAEDAVEFITALGLTRIDLLGFSLGCFVAQEITRPLFVANGDSDPMILPRYSHLLAGLLPNATIKIYPDAAHGFLFQHYEQFAADIAAFLTE